MTTHSDETPTLHDPTAALERDLIAAYLTAAGHSLHDLLVREDAEAKQLLGEASRYASAKLSEAEARLHYLQHLKGES